MFGLAFRGTRRRMGGRGMTLYTVTTEGPDGLVYEQSTGNLPTALGWLADEVTLTLDHYQEAGYEDLPSLDTLVDVSPADLVDNGVHYVYLGQYRHKIEAV